MSQFYSSNDGQDRYTRTLEMRDVSAGSIATAAHGLHMACCTCRLHLHSKCWRQLYATVMPSLVVSEFVRCKKYQEKQYLIS